VLLYSVIEVPILYKSTPYLRNIKLLNCRLTQLYIYIYIYMYMYIVLWLINYIFHGEHFRCCSLWQHGLCIYVCVPISVTALWDVCLRPLVFWDCVLESHRGHGCLSLVNVVCVCGQVEVFATGRSLVERSPTECGMTVISMP